MIGEQGNQKPTWENPLGAQHRDVELRRKCEFSFSAHTNSHSPHQNSLCPKHLRWHATSRRGPYCASKEEENASSQVEVVDQDGLRRQNSCSIHRMNGQKIGADSIMGGVGSGSHWCWVPAGCWGRGRCRPRFRPSGTSPHPRHLHHPPYLGSGFYYSNA